MPAPTHWELAYTGITDPKQRTDYMSKQYLARQLIRESETTASNRELVTTVIGIMVVFAAFVLYL